MKKIFILEDNEYHFKDIKNTLIHNLENIEIFPSTTAPWLYNKKLDDEDSMMRTEFDYLRRCFLKLHNKDINANEFFGLITDKYSDMDFFIIDIELANGDKLGLDFKEYIKSQGKEFLILTSYEYFDLPILKEDDKYMSKSDIKNSLIPKIKEIWEK